MGETGMYQILMNPVLIIFVVLTVLAILGKFFKVWIVSIIVGAIAGSFLIVIIITLGQFIGEEDIIRNYITSYYLVLDTIILSFGDILLVLLLLYAFLIALIGHTLNMEKSLKERLSWLPKRLSHHYEMEHTLGLVFKKQR
jgi:hypothetical protein